jgi:hypothetical protein
MLQQNGIEAFPKLGLGAWAVDIWVQGKDAADAAKLLPPP